MTTRQELLNAHIKFELKNIFLDPDKFLKTEITTFVDVVGNLTIEQTVPEENLKRLIRNENMLTHYNDFVTEVFANIAKNLKEFISNKNLELRDIINKEHFKIIVNDVITMKEIRKEVIHQVCISGIYSRFISDILYRGIKNFALEENFVAKKIPGASQLIDFGRNLMSKVPGVDDGMLDEKLIAFVQTNIKQTLHDSEHYLNDTLDGEFSRVLVQDLWDLLNSLPPGKSTKKISDEELKNLINSIVKATDEFRSSDLFLEVISKTVHSVYKDLKGFTILELLKKSDLEKEVLVKQIALFVLPLFNNPTFQKYLEIQLKKRLEQFYESEECKRIIHQN